MKRCDLIFFILVEYENAIVDERAETGVLLLPAVGKGSHEQAFRAGNPLDSSHDSLDDRALPILCYRVIRKTETAYLAVEDLKAIGQRAIVQDIAGFKANHDIERFFSHVIDIMTRYVNVLKRQGGQGYLVD